jgi:hypothetical protein
MQTTVQKQIGRRHLMRNAMYQFPTDHSVQLTQRKKGRLEFLQHEFIEQSGYQITLNYLKDSVRLFRKERGIQLVNAENPYYIARTKIQ